MKDFNLKNIIKRPAIIASALLTFCYAGTVSAQQNFQMSQYMNGALVLNPAFSGIEDQTEANIGYRQQWANWDGTGSVPTTAYFTANARLPFNRESQSVSMPLHTSDASGGVIENSSKKTGGNNGVGIYVYSDKYAYFNRFSAAVSYANHKKLNDKLALSVGAALGLTGNRINASQLTIYDNVNDDSYINLQGANQNRNSLEMNIGAMLYSQDFFIGYSANQLTRGKQFALTEGIESAFSVHHYIMAGYKMEMSEDLYFTPTMIIQALSASPVTVEFTGKVIYKNQYWGGVSLRNEDAIVIMAGLKPSKNLGLSYSYDINTSEMKNHSSGGHEITLGAFIGKPDREVRNDFIWQ